jgi:hypothetical protein
MAGRNIMAANNQIAFVAALLIWAAIFYAMDRYIMTSQGLPVGADLMPL